PADQTGLFAARAQPQRRHGSGAFRLHQSLWLSGAAQHAIARAAGSTPRSVPRGTAAFAGGAAGPSAIIRAHSVIPRNSVVSMSNPVEVQPRKVVQGEKLRGADKVARTPVKILPTEELPKKPDWIRVRMGSSARVEE